LPYREGEVKARDLMQPAGTVRPDDSCKELVRHIQDPSVRVLAVVSEGGEVLGMVTEEDVLSALLPSYVLADEALAGALEETAGAELGERLQHRRVKDVVDLGRRDRPTVAPDDTLVEVGAAMARSNDPGVLVVEGGRLLGAITVDRLLAALLRHTG
jgi:CBS domain-containing protein